MDDKSSKNSGFNRLFTHIFLCAGLLLALLLPTGATPAFAYGLASISVTDTSLTEGDGGSSVSLLLNLAATITSTTATSTIIDDDDYPLWLPSVMR